MSDVCLFMDDIQPPQQQSSQQQPLQQPPENKNTLKVSQQEGNLHIDMRESDLMKRLSQPHSSSALPIGDIWIGPYDKPVLVLERKTAPDFSSSVTDGRYREQRGRLLAFSEQTGARIAYVIEGPLTCRLGEKAITKLIARMQLVHGVPVFRTKSVADTAEFSECMLEYWKHEPTCFSAATTAQRAVDSIHVIKKDNAKDPHTFAVSVLCQCPGVSVKVAEGWLSEFDSLKGVLAASEEALSAVKIAGRKQPAAAAKFRSIWAS